MRFSIIVPVYNVAEFLPECVDSLLDQNCGAYEILLVDDGSTDESGAICDRYAADNPELVRVIHQPNGGLGDARNTGITQARGEYLWFVDSDDRVAPESLERLSEQIDETPADMIVFGFSSLTDGTLTPGESNPLAGQGSLSCQDHPELLLGLPSAWMRIWHRRLFADGTLRFPPRVWYEDIRTTPKALVLSRSVVVIPDRLYHYRQRPGSIMNNRNLQRNLEIVEAMEDLRTWFAQQGLTARYGRELEALAAEHLLLSASVRVARVDPRSEVLPRLRAYMEQHYPCWQRNPHRGRLSRLRRIALWLVEHRRYRLLNLLFRLKG